MSGNVFGRVGKVCAGHPWKVIAGVLTVTACMLSMNKTAAGPHNTTFIDDESTHESDVIVMNIIRFTTVLYIYKIFINLRQLDSKYVLGVAAILTVFSSFVSSTIVTYYLSGDLKNAIFLFLFVVLINLKKASFLAQSALNGCSQTEVINNISKGMSLLGPSFSLDSVVCGLVTSVGMLSGIQLLETLCMFTCTSIVVNFLVMMSFYPACLSLVLDLLRRRNKNRMPFRSDRSQISEICNDQEANAVVQPAKVILLVGVMIVHAQSQWTLSSSMEMNRDNNIMLEIRDKKFNVSNETEKSIHCLIYNSVAHLMTGGTNYITLFILLLSTIVWLWFLERSNEPACKLVNKTLPLNVFENANQMQDQEVSIVTSNKIIETETTNTNIAVVDENNTDIRTLKECLAIYKSQKSAENLTDEEVLMLIKSNHVKPYMLEKCVNSAERGVSLRRKLIAAESDLTKALAALPYAGYDYSKVLGKNCENVVGYVAVPVGVAGPLLVDGVCYQVPMATTEGCLVASTNRGCRALSMCGGVITRILDDGMTRGPVVRFSSISTASDAKLWIDDPDNFQTIKSAFDSTSRFAKLTKTQVRIAGRRLFIRFTASTGDAMGMNMLSKGTEESLKVIGKQFSDMEILSLSGNFCSDKKPAAVNWIEGRGKYVVSEAVVPAKIVTDVLKTTVAAIVDVNISKNLMGSAIAGSIGGNNAHAANIVTAVYIATGQDPAQNVSSSNCMTLMEASGDDLRVSCTMPSVEVGTVGGGTSLPGQSACLEMLGVRGASPLTPGDNAKRLARILCATVLAGELSLMSALTAGHLVQSHMTHNRSSCTAQNNPTPN